MSLLILSIVFLAGIYSCKPANERSCFKRSGESDSLLIELPSFDKLILGEHMRFVLVQDTIEKSSSVWWIEFIESNYRLIPMNSNEISISNENRCRFFRYRNNDIIVYIHFIGLNEIVFNGSEELKQ